MSLEALLRQLVAFRTTSRNHEENLRALDWISEQVATKRPYRRTKRVGSFPSLYLATRRTKTPKLLLSAHVDVVPGPDKIFSARRSGRTLVGRGVFDMKYAIACFIKLFQELDPARYDLGMLITSDEELGGANGVPAWLRDGYGAECCFLPDGQNDWNLVSGSKGVLHFHAAAKGKSAHASRPWQGRSAIETLLEFLADCRREIPIPDRRSGPRRDTLNVGVIRGGEQTNSIAAAAEAEIDVRFVEYDQRYYRKLLARLAKRHQKITITPVIEADRFSVDQQDPAIVLWRKTVHEKIGRRPAFHAANGSSDARFFCGQGIPTIVTRPRGGHHHSDEEWVDLDELVRFYEALKEFTARFATR